MCCEGIPILEDVEEVVEDVGDVVGDVVEGVGDVIEGVGDVVTDAIDGVMNTVENVMSDPMAMASIALTLAVPGLGTAIGAAFGATGTAATVLGNSIMRGVMAEATGGDFVQSAMASAITGGMGQYAGDVGAAFGIEDAAAAKAVGSAVLKTGYAAATGGNVSGAAIEGAIVGAISMSNAATTKDTAVSADVAAGIDPSYGSSESYDDFMKKAMTPEAATAIETGIDSTAANAPDDRDIGGGWSPAATTPEVNPYEAFDATEREGTLAKSTETSKDITIKDVAKAVAPFVGVGTAKVATSLMSKSSQNLDFEYKPPTGKALYKDAPLAGYEMVKLTNDQGMIRYIPFINGKPQLKVPSGYKQVEAAQGGFIQRRV